MKTAWKVGPPRISEVARARSVKSVSLGRGVWRGRENVQVVRTRVRRVPKKRQPKILWRIFGSATCGKQMRWGFLEDLWTFFRRWVPLFR